MIVRRLTGFALALAIVLLVRPCEASCEEISWDLRDVLRELVVARVGQAGPLAASQVDARLRGRGLPFTKPIFRFARGTNLARVAVGEQPHDLAPCEVSEVFHDVPSPEGPVSVAAALRVESAVLAFDAEEEPASWRVVARVREEVPLEAFEIVVGAQRGAARSHALRREGSTLRATVPRGALEGPVTMQIVAQTPLGPEVIAELRTTTPTLAPEIVAPAPGARAESLIDALNAARANLGVPKLQEDAALQRFAERTLAAAVERGLLAHRTPEGLVAERLKAAHVSTRRAGELLARLAAGEPPAERFLASPAHRVIMGDPKLRSVGVAEGKGPDGLRWVVVVLTSP
jgi:uncharacterized protein YkwD